MVLVRDTLSISLKNRVVDIGLNSHNIIVFREARMKHYWGRLLVLLFMFMQSCQPIKTIPVNQTEPALVETISPEPIVEIMIPSPPSIPIVPLAEVTNSPNNQHHVAVGGLPSATGTIDDPWDLQTALNHPADVKAGDTIWLHEGIYIGKFYSRLQGADNNPITVRQYPGERVILANSDLVLDIQESAWVDFWGFEITASENDRDPVNRPESAYGVRINQGRDSDHIRFINMMIYNMPAQGFGWWIRNTNSEIYGSLIFYNGVNQFDHGIYVKNQNGTKIIRDNFIFDNASHGIHAYSSEENTLNNLVITGNTLFNNGSIGYSTRKNTYGIYERNILVGGYNLVTNAQIEENYTYYPGSEGESLNLGYRFGAVDSTVFENYFMGGSVTLGGIIQNIDFAKNTIYAPGSINFSQTDFFENVYDQTKPVQNKIFIRQNLFEDNRFNITIYNWEGMDEITLNKNLLEDLAWVPGTAYQLHNVQDFYGDILVGVYDGEALIIPMTNHSVQQPLGLNFVPASTFPEFGAFVLIFTPD